MENHVFAKNRNELNTDLFYLSIITNSYAAVYKRENTRRYCAAMTCNTLFKFVLPGSRILNISFKDVVQYNGRF